MNRIPGSKLSNEQQQALQALRKGSVTVIAGPGSGKTHTLLAAVRQTMQTNPAANILCLTFTNKAADNLKQNMPDNPQLFVGTFHSLAARLRQPDETGTIADSDTVYALLAGLKRSRSLLGANVRELGLMISRYKNGSLSSDAARHLAAAYDNELRARGLIDYDDLILYALEQTAALAPYDYLFVDEFQDTSPKQYELLLRLSGKQTKRFVIGDPKQSIYRFRGADGSIFAALASDTAAPTITLTRNYRSSTSIVAAANRIFTDQHPQRAEQKLVGRVVSIETLDEFSEPACVAAIVQQALGGTEWQYTHHDLPDLHADSFGDFAVLYRTRRQGELLSRKLRQAGLPVQRLGEDSPYMAPLARLLSACIVYIIKPDDAGKLAIDRAAASAKLSIKTGQLLMIDPAASPANLVSALADNLDQTDSEAALLLGNLAARFTSLPEFAAYLQALAEQAFFDPHADALCLSTIHASKGLEFRHVFVAGCNDGVLPNGRAENDEGVAEERRLFYVAVTRARDTLTLLHTRSWAGKTSRPSPFIQVTAAVEQLDPSLAATERTRTRRRQQRAQQKLL